MISRFIKHFLIYELRNLKTRNFQVIDVDNKEQVQKPW